MEALGELMLQSVSRAACIAEGLIEQVPDLTSHFDTSPADRDGEV